MGPAFDDKHLEELSAFMEIDTEKDWKHVSKRMGFGPKRLIHPLWWAAASIVLLLGIGGLSLSLLNEKSELLVLNTQHTQQCHAL